MVIDPGDDPAEIAREVESRGLRVHAILATHGHHDHVSAVATLAGRWDAAFLVHPADAGLLRKMNFLRRFIDGTPPVRVPKRWDRLVPGSTLHFGTFDVGVIGTPGHSPGSVSFLVGDALFLGDVLLPAGVGRTDLPGGDETALQRTLQELASFPGHTTIFPGHGDPFSLRDGLGSIGYHPSASGEVS